MGGNSRAMAAARAAFPPRAQINLDPPFFLNLLTPAFVLSLMHRWAALAAPRLGHYFTMEAVAFVYSYYVLGRAVYIHHNGRDAEGRYDAARARKAEQAFYRIAGDLSGMVRVPVLVLVAVAIAADFATVGHQFAAQRACERPILVVSFLVWTLVAPAYIVACARWSEVTPFDLTAARRIVWENLWQALNFIVAIFVILAGVWLINLLYLPLRMVVAMVLPFGMAIAIFASLFVAAIITYAVWVQCLWSQAFMDRLAQKARPRTAKLLVRYKKSEPD